MDVIIQQSLANEDFCLPAYSIPVAILRMQSTLSSLSIRFPLPSRAQVGTGEGTGSKASLTELWHSLCESKQLTSPLWASLMTPALMNTDFTCCSEGRR